MVDGGDVKGGSPLNILEMSCVSSRGASESEEDTLPSEEEKPSDEMFTSDRGRFLFIGDTGGESECSVMPMGT
tara:strand:+ start:311 stop:529 length:219 start_codon:yes stop_codon:yes gene_type:complete